PPAAGGTHENRPARGERRRRNHLFFPIEESVIKIEASGEVHLLVVIKMEVSSVFRFQRREGPEKLVSNRAQETDEAVVHLSEEKKESYDARHALGCGF